MYKIKAPSEEYDRKIGGVQFVSGEAQTDNEWLASWFSGRAGFTVETVTAEEETEPTEDKPSTAAPALAAAVGRPVGGRHGHAVCRSVQARLPRPVPHLRLQSQRRAMRLRRPGRGRMGRCHGKSICSIEESQARRVKLW